MRTKEEAQAQGEKFRHALIEWMLRHGKALREIDDTHIREQQAASIAETMKFVHERVKPNYEGRTIILGEAGRASRSFDFEFERLWNRTVMLYVIAQIASVTSIPVMDSFLKDPANAEAFDEFRRDVIEQLHTVLLPLIEQHETLGDDFYLYINELMFRADPKATVEIIADNGKTPPEIMTAIFGMFGLLVQARNAAQSGDKDRAYSFLLDANHLLGMHEGAKYAGTYLPKTAAKRQAKLNSAKSRASKDKIKRRAFDLYYELRPLDEHGKRPPWASASAAMTEIWAVLVEDAYAQGQGNPGIAEKTILAQCQDLFRRDKEGSSLDIRVEVVERPAPG
jgi:hypothetical protein